MALACRGALVNEDGLQVVHLTYCVLLLAVWGLVWPKVYAQRKAELVCSLHLHQLLQKIVHHQPMAPKININDPANCTTAILAVQTRTLHNLQRGSHC